jgi:hypothetical protein
MQQEARLQRTEDVPGICRIEFAAMVFALTGLSNNAFRPSKGSAAAHIMKWEVEELA